MCGRHRLAYFPGGEVGVKDVMEEVMEGKLERHGGVFCVYGEVSTCVVRNRTIRDFRAAGGCGLFVFLLEELLPLENAKQGREERHT